MVSVLPLNCVIGGYIDISLSESFFLSFFTFVGLSEYACVLVRFDASINTFAFRCLRL